MLLSTFLLFSMFWNFTTCMPKMVVVYATVNSTQIKTPGCTANDQIQWKYCVLWCAGTSTCMIAIKTPTGCVYCDYGKIKTAQSSVQSTQQEIAYKIESDPDTCAAPGAPSWGNVENGNYTVELINGAYTFNY